MGPHRSGSFSYKIINEKIVKTLDNRAQMNNTVQIAMPFIKATTTLQLDEVLGAGSKGFTLGLHAIDKDVKYQDMFSEQDSDMPLIGYTYTPTGTKLVYAKNRNDEYANTISRVFDLRTTLATTPSEKKFTRVPPPGISQVNIGTAKNGLLSSATMQVQVPSLAQLEALHRTFLVPGIGMVLEWGQQYALEKRLDEYGEPIDITQYMFPWHDPAELDIVLTHLAKKEVGLMDILEKHVYPAQGQYSWMFGRVANFSTKANSDGSFDCSVKIVGPSEDSWAYSTKNTVVPRKEKGSFYCAEKTNSVYSYFAESTPQGPLNFKSLLDDALNNKVPGWEGHVQILKQDSNVAGEPEKDEKRPNEDKKTFADSEDSYFLSWRFFVNVVLNDPVRGIKKIFNDALPDEANNVSLLLPFATGEGRKNTKVGQIKYLDDPMEPYVGMNQYLRSVDPSTMLIINEKAVQLAKKNPQYNMGTSERDFLTHTEKSKLFRDSVVGLFEQASGEKDRGLLSSGVWLNHKAVVLSMIGADTILRGVSNLLERMNQASLNYWQLTIDVAEGSMMENRGNNYTVVDANFRESAEDAVSKFLDKVYMFNKYVRVDNDTGKLVGSELIDCVVDLSLPKRLFSQIATMGLVQPETLHNAGVTSGSGEEGSDFNVLKPPKLSDPNDTLREMFAITVLSVKDDATQGPDLTILPKTKRDAAVAANALCGKANTQVPSGVGGVGHRPNDNNPSASTNNIAKQEAEKLKQEAQKKLDTSECKQCLTCPPPKDNKVDTQQTSKKLTQLTVGKIQALQAGGAGNRSVFAVGKYQAIPDTLSAWVSDKGISPSVTFDSNLQEKLGDWLVTEKRPLLEFFKGEISLNQIQLELAQEFASMPIPGPRELRRSYYEGDSAGNRAGVSSGDFQDVLQRALDQHRQGNTSGAVKSVKEFISKSEGSYDAINRGKAGDTQTDSEEYYKALNGQGAVIPPEKRCSDDVYEKVGSTGTPSPTFALENQTTGFGLFENPLLTDQQKVNIQKGRSICRDCEKAKVMLDQANKKLNELTEQEETNPIKEATIKKFYGLQDSFIYVEVFPEYMVSQIAEDADGNMANSFGTSPGSLSIYADLTMPGISGIRVGELFWIDRMPVFYKAFGAFQVMSIEDTIGLDGWKTKIHARFNFLGKKWKEAMAKKLSPTN
jgi:hypothetical protein